LAESSSTLFCLQTGLSLPVALHPVSQRRSYLQLRTGQCSRPEGISTLLLVRTLRRTPVAPAGQALGPYIEPDPGLKVEAVENSELSSGFVHVGNPCSFKIGPVPENATS
jgi:hypothetical protein